MLPFVRAKHIPQVSASWQARLSKVLDPREFQAMLQRVEATYQRGIVYPCWDDIFRAFHLTTFQGTRVVLLGQDPYHGAGQAHGLCFSVPQGEPLPPSLRNIYKELHRDLGIPPARSGDLSPWARQGVLLLNSSLTVSAGAAGSHQHLGWEQFTDAVITTLSDHGRPGLIFLLWGNFAQKKASLIDGTRHHILKAPHPSPLSAHRGFIGCGHFSSVNTILASQGDDPIDWSLH